MSDKCPKRALRQMAPVKSFKEIYGPLSHIIVAGRIQICEITTRSPKTTVCSRDQVVPRKARASRALASAEKCPSVPIISLDELAGRKESAEPQMHNPELHRLYRKVDQLSDQDQQALVIVLDSLVKRSRVKRVMGE